MLGSKVHAMVRIARDTDVSGAASFPSFMKDNMRQWEREGLVVVSVNQSGGFTARITEAGRKLAKKAIK